MICDLLVGGSEQAHVAICLANGSLDTTFGANGLALADLGADEEAHDLAVEAMS